MSDPATLIADLDRFVLRRLANMTGPNSPFGMGYTATTLAWLTCDHIKREMARAVVRDLTDRGMALYMRGLFSDDGMVAGAGYGITEKGMRYLAALEECER